MKVKTHKFSTGVFKINFDGVDGYCDAPEFNDDKHREIVVQPGQSAFSEMETVLHETTHAEHPDMPEHRVRDSAHNIARLLWRLGYRKVKK